MRRSLSLVLLSLACLALVASGSGVKRWSFAPAKSGAAARYLLVEFLQDDLVHFEVAGSHDAPKDFNSKGIWISPMISRRDFPGPSSVTEFRPVESKNKVTLSSPLLRVEVDVETLEVTVVDLQHTPELVLSHFSYDGLDGKSEWAKLHMSSDWVRDVYGLGEHYMNPYGSFDGNFMNNRFLLAPEEPHGNAMFPLYIDNVWKGITEIANFPVMYAVGEGKENFGLFLDDVHAKEWFFDERPFFAQMKATEIRWFVFAGENLLSLRQTYMSLVGHSPVPPRRAFGLWQSIFGYRNWSQLYDDVDSLVHPQNDRHRFPMDGVVFDLYWFGGGFYEDSPESVAEKSRMGSLHWDLSRFPAPGKHIKDLKSKGIGSLVIEESYVSIGAQGFEPMDKKGYLVKDCETCGSTILGRNGEGHWWGVGGMVDWSNSEGAAYWFDCKNCPLMEECKYTYEQCKGMLSEEEEAKHEQKPATFLAEENKKDDEEDIRPDVVGWWLDLGEPEKYHAWAHYHGYPVSDGKMVHSHADYHNLHNFLWVESVFKGYQRNNLNKRPWMLCRNGAAGINRFGAGMWSGDIYPDLRNMASSLSIQKHMSMVGIDYFGSDIGGFHRHKTTPEEIATDDERFTQWLANSAWFDVPVRPHAWQPDDRMEIQSAPSKIGDLYSNLYSLRQRYSLTPYYYTLAYRAWLYGEPVVPPLVVHFQEDSKVRQMGHEKLIGRDILVACSSTLNQRQRDVYLPAGEWVDMHSRKYHHTAKGEWLRNVPQTLTTKAIDGVERTVFVLPAFVRAGAIIPLMHVDQFTKNTLGERWTQAKEEANSLEALQGSSLVGSLYFAAYVPVPADEAKSSSFSVFEDDGESVAYHSGQYRETVIKLRATAKDAEIFIESPKGTFPSASAQRRVVVKAVLPPVLGKTLSSVSIMGQPVQKFDHQAEREFWASEGAACWFADGEHGQELIVKSAVLPVDGAKVIVLSF